MNNEPLKIKKRGEDGNKIISVRIKEDTLLELDKIAAECNYSRNELIKSSNRIRSFSFIRAPDYSIFRETNISWTNESTESTEE